MGVSLGIVGKNTQQYVEVHTHKTGFGRRTGARNINGSIIKSIYEIHAPEGAAM
jgi:hypothetical protein